jgi:butyrate kinase
MIMLDTEEKLNWFFEAFENGDIIVDGTNTTEEEHAETARQIQEYKERRKALFEQGYSKEEVLRRLDKTYGLAANYGISQEQARDYKLPGYNGDEYAAYAIPATAACAVAETVAEYKP